MNIRELSGPEKKSLIYEVSLISGFGLFIYINTGSNLGHTKYILYPGLLYTGYTVYIYI